MDAVHAASRDLVAALGPLSAHGRIGLLSAALGREAVATGQPAIVLALAHEIARQHAGLEDV